MRRGAGFFDRYGRIRKGFACWYSSTCSDHDNDVLLEGDNGTTIINRVAIKRAKIRPRSVSAHGMLSSAQRREHRICIFRVGGEKG